MLRFAIGIPGVAVALLLAACTAGGTGPSTWPVSEGDPSAPFVADTLNATPPVAAAIAIHAPAVVTAAAPTIERSTLLSRLVREPGLPPSSDEEVATDLLRWRGEHFGLVAEPTLARFSNQIRARLLNGASLADPGGAVHLTAAPNLAPHPTRHGNLLLSLAWFDRVADEDALAAVIATGLSHVLLRHHLDPAGVAYRRAGVESAPAGQPVPAMPPAAARQASDVGLEPRWQPHQQREAALLAQDLLIAAGYDATAIERIGDPDAAQREDWARYRAAHYPSLQPVAPSVSVLRVVQSNAAATRDAYAKAYRAQQALQGGEEADALRLARESVRALGELAVYPNWVLYLAARDKGRSAEAFGALERAFRSNDDLVEPVYYEYSEALGQKRRFRDALDVAERGHRVFGGSADWLALQIRWLGQVSRKADAESLAIECGRRFPEQQVACRSALGPAVRQASVQPDR